VGLGADGASCNNNLDIIEEMRLAALLQQWKQQPGFFTALNAVEMATIEGAKAIGKESEIGSIEIGKRGDVVVLDLNLPASFGGDSVSVYDRLVYGAGRDSVRWVVVDGEILVRESEFVHMDRDEIYTRAQEELRSLLTRCDVQF
jgi:5-methylthioadenosine/S-adenosylhomocysteine deaminase